MPRWAFLITVGMTMAMVAMPYLMSMDAYKDNYAEKDTSNMVSLSRTESWRAQRLEAADL